MSRVRIDFTAPNNEGLYDRLMQAFIDENGYPADHYEDYYRGYTLWESELTGWLSAVGYPCWAWVQKPSESGLILTQGVLPQGLEMEEETATLFWIKWS